MLNQLPDGLRFVDDELNLENYPPTVRLALIAVARLASQQGHIIIVTDLKSKRGSWQISLSAIDAITEEYLSAASSEIEYEYEESFETIANSPITLSSV